MNLPRKPHIMVIDGQWVCMDWDACGVGHTPEIAWIHWVLDVRVQGLS